MRARAFRNYNTREVKCNLCHQWIMSANQNRNTLNSCSLCLEKYIEGGEIWSQNGQKFKLMLIKEEQYSSQSFLKHYDGFQEQTQHSRVLPFSLSKIEEMMQNCQLSIAQRQLIGSRIEDFNRQYEQQAENICQLIKQLRHAKSLTYFHEENYQKTQAKYKSEIFQEEPYLRGGQKQLKTCKLEDFCLNLDRTRYVKTGYEYYFDSQQRSRFANQYGQIIEQRAFGAELSSNQLNQQSLFLDLNRKTSIKNNPSFNLQPNSIRQLRMSEQILKQKIGNFLQNKHPSSSLHKIIHMNTKEAYERTNIYQKMVELISFKISSIDLTCYLNLFEPQNIQTVKLVNVGLNNPQLGLLLDYIWNRKVQRLVLSGNRLTDGCLPIFLSRSLPFLKQIYLGKNRINKYRMKQNIVELRSKFVIYI